MTAMARFRTTPPLLSGSLPDSVHAGMLPDYRTCPACVQIPRALPGSHGTNGQPPLFASVRSRTCAPDRTRTGRNQTRI